VPAGPVGGWVKTDGYSTLIVGCNGTAGVWRLTCVDGRWTGATGNCTTSPANTGNSAAYLLLRDLDISSCGVSFTCPKTVTHRGTNLDRGSVE